MLTHRTARFTICPHIRTVNAIVVNLAKRKRGYKTKYIRKSDGAYVYLRAEREYTVGKDELLARLKSVSRGWAQEEETIEKVQKKGLGAFKRLRIRA